MSERDVKTTLRQIVGFAEEIALLLRGRTREQLDENAEFRRALERCVELIGEAATRLPADWREQQPDIPWRQIIAMRNVMIHGYDNVLLDVLWDTATVDVPPLRERVAGILAQLGTPES